MALILLSNKAYVVKAMFFGTIPPSSSLLAEKNPEDRGIINYCHTALHVGIVFMAVNLTRLRVYTIPT